MSTMLDTDTILAVDVGSVSTRASLFDVVDGHFRLIASGRAPSTAKAPLFDISEGVRMALDQVVAVTGRKLLDETDLLIMPVTSQGSGVDSFVATASAGPKVRTVLVGLMPGVSTDSALRLADSTYLDLVGVIDLLDSRREAEKIDLILSARPDLILVVGGTDGGAQDSVLQLIELVAVASELFSPNQRPRIVYAGNRNLGAAIADRVGERLDIALAPNVRPSLRVEDLGHARLALGEAIAEGRNKRVRGFDELEQWSGGAMMLTADAYGRVIRYLSRIY
ncbi:MAG: glutamate mutase L, partial [Anaerolineales bacterium]|nr:glutamate mutase L [Anaerolineales bacterium]